VKPKELSDGQAKASLASRLSSVVDRGRQLDARLGFRPYRVHLVWTRWDGREERGDGRQEVVARFPIEPTPIVSDLTALRAQSFSAGRAYVGDLRITEISARLPLRLLLGQVLPDRLEDEVPHPYSFFWEVFEDGRHCPPEERKRFSPSSAPFLDAPNQQWIVTLEKQSGDMGKDGRPVDVVVPPSLDPWKSRRLEAPPEGDDD
jgi:hypothetical protein